MSEVLSVPSMNRVRCIASGLKSEYTEFIEKSPPGQYMR